MSNSAKKQLRQLIENYKNNLSEQQKAEKSSLVFAQVERLYSFENAHLILIYWSLPDELQTHPFIRKYIQHKNICLPIVVEDKLHIKHIHTLDDLTKGTFDILEPASHSPEVKLEDIELAIIPGIAFTVNGDRLGRGKGYYDRLLKQAVCPKIGVCFQEQIVDDMPSDPWDVQMNQMIFA